MIVRKKQEYRGMVYDIGVCGDSSIDWGNKAGHFYAEGGFGLVTAETMSGVRETYHAEIDRFLDGVPGSDAEWVELLEDCFIGDGEVCEEKAMHVLNLYKQAPTQEVS